MNKQLAIRLSFLLVLVIVSSCTRDGENLDECIRNMRIELRWMNTQPLDDNERVNIEIIPSLLGNTTDITSDIYGVNVDLLTDDYRIFGWETYSGVDLDVTTNTLSVHTQEDGTVVSPPLFSAGSTTATVELYSGSQIIPLPVYRQVRPLVIQINFIGDGYALVNGVTGTLQGITLERSLDNGFPPVNGLSRPAAIRSGNMNYTFNPMDNAAAEIWYAGTQNLIGIDGNASQTLNLNLAFTGDNGTSAFEFDVTEQLAEFHTKDTSEPWYIVLTLNLGANLDISIVDWISGAESWIIAH